MMHLLRKYDVAPLRSAMMRCLPEMWRSHASLGVAVIIGRSPASFAEGNHHSKNAPLSVDKSAFFVGAGNGIRTRSSPKPCKHRFFVQVNCKEQFCFAKFSGLDSVNHSKQTPLRKSGGVFVWSGQRESNPHSQLGKLIFYH